MKRLARVSLCVVFVAYCAGCATNSYVIVEPRPIPEYPSQGLLPAPAATIAICPTVISAGDAETRRMREAGYRLLVKEMEGCGYRVAPSDAMASEKPPKCIVELVECRHDMPEVNSGRIVSIVTVIAVRVRGPGVLRDGRMTFGIARAFQGVFREKLGARPNGFVVTDVV